MPDAANFESLLSLAKVKPSAAISFLRQRSAITTDRYGELEAAAHAKAFTSAGITEARMLNQVHGHLYKGDGKLAGIFGVTAAAIAVLNRLTVSGAGTAYVVSASSAELAQFLSDGQSSVLLTIEFDNVSLDEAVVVSKLDTLKTIYETYVDSKTGAVL